jgi:phenylalanyl-tRNA synthetase beta chain
MKILLSWLRDYIDINIPAGQIAKILTSLGIEVDAIEARDLGFQKVVVGRVIKVQKHPNADNLSVASVTDGTEVFQVVCGAPNCREGIKTALALVGAALSDPSGQEFRIKKTKLRGIESNGMLCSGMELGISEDHIGILEFADHIKEGTDISEIFADTIFEISLTPNLAHCNSYIGIARELAAATGLSLKLPKNILNEDTHENIENHIQVQVLDTVKCPRYACRLLRDVDIKASPDWIKTRLEASGIRPVNNAVDITNYVLLEWGHPMHAFDFDLIEGKQLLVHTAKEKEKFTALDDKTRVLSSSDLMIADPNKSIAIAGIMGGQNSEVTDSTRNILLEAAYFQPSSIRKSSKMLSLSTESSKRFERGCDPNALITVLDRAAMLIQEIAGGSIVGGYIDIKEQEFPSKSITCRLNKLNSLLGIHLSIGEVESIFRRLDFHCHWNGHDSFKVTVPTYRVDVNAEIDLFEEVARLYGYDKIPLSDTRYHGTQLPHSSIFIVEREVRQQLLASGLQEFLTCDLVGPALMNIVQDTTMPPEVLIQVLNPTSIEQSVMRTSLLPGLLQVVKYNFDHQNPDISGFEMGRIHFKQGDQYKEPSVAGIILTGKNRPHHWDQKSMDVDFFDLKGILEGLFQELRIENISFRENRLETFHPGRQAGIYVDSYEIGSMGEIHPAIQRRLDIPQRIYFAEFNLHDVLRLRKQESKMIPLPIYPGSERDWTVTLPEVFPVEKILNLIKAIEAPLLKEALVRDLYRSEKLGKDLKNLTLRFVYRDDAKTLEQEEVDAAHKNIITTVLSLIEK